MGVWTKSKKFTGVRIYKFDHDETFYIFYRGKNKKLRKEKVGRKSEGYTLQDATTIRQERIRTLRHGKELPQEKDSYTFSELAEKVLQY